jgi:hypothetical protein
MLLTHLCTKSMACLLRLVTYVLRLHYTVMSSTRLLVCCQSMNLSKYDEWKDTDAVQTAIVFLDCVAQEFIEQGRGIKGIERAVRLLSLVVR